ncbi:MAG: hypothetical protein ACM3OO_02275 [Planctomycetaceae bacterium]
MRPRDALGPRAMALVAVLALALALVAAPAASRTDPVCAATSGPHAGLVVDTGSRVLEYCVALDAGTVSGLHLIELAHAQYGLSYGFGLGGLAVCRLDGVGPAGDDCFADYPDYWGYWHGNGHGGWTWASTGAGEAKVGDGDLDGWSWGAGDSGTNHPAPPSTTIDAVCPPAAARSTATSPPTRASTAAASPTQAAKPTTAASPSARPTATRTRRPSSPSPTLETSAETATARTRAAAPPATPSSGGGLPTGLLAAVALAGLLGAGGWLRLRSRSRGAA